MSSNLIKKYTQMATPTKGSYLERRIHPQNHEYPQDLQKTLQNGMQFHQNMTNFHHHQRSAYGSGNKDNLNSNSIITLEQENELRGEISYCKEEVDHLKKEIKKFNDVLKNKIVMDEDWGRKKSVKSRSGRKRRGKTRRPKYQNSPQKSRSPDQSSLLLKSVTNNGTANKTIIAPGLSPGKSTHGNNQTTFERILDSSALDQTRVTTFQQKSNQKSMKYLRGSDKRLPTYIEEENQENIPQNYDLNLSKTSRNRIERHPHLDNSRHTPQTSRLSRQEPHYSQRGELKKLKHQHYKTGSFGGQIQSQASPAYTYNSRCTSPNSRKRQVLVEYSRSPQRQYITQAKRDQYNHSYLVQPTSIHPKSPYSSKRQNLKTPNNHNTQRPAHKELIVNLQDEVNFLAKQNTRLKTAIMNSSGIGLIPTFYNLFHNSMDALKNQILSKNVGYQKRISSYENKISSIFQTMAHLKHRIHVQKQKHAEFNDNSIRQIQHLRNINGHLTQENSILNKDALKMSEVLSQKELKIQSLMKEVAMLKKNQFTPEMKQGKTYVFSL